MCWEDLAMVLQRILPRNTPRSYKDLVKDLARSYFNNRNTGKFFKVLLRSCKDFAKILIRKYSNISKRSYGRSY